MKTKNKKIKTSVNEWMKQKDNTDKNDRMDENYEILMKFWCVKKIMCTLSQKMFLRHPKLRAQNSSASSWILEIVVASSCGIKADKTDSAYLFRIISSQSKFVIIATTPEITLPLSDFVFNKFSKGWTTISP